MGQKRDFAEIGSPDPDHAPADSQPSTKRRQIKTKNKPSEGTTGWARKRMRNIDRLLKKNQELPANVRNDLERELTAHSTTLSERNFQKHRSAMISKYHMVRFFERKRALRLSKQIRKKLEASTDPEETEELRRHLHIVEVDEAYTQHHPHAEVYVSLYAANKPDKDEDDDEQKAAKNKALLEAPRPPIWAEVEQAMKYGPGALRELRERRSADSSAANRRSDRGPRTTKPDARTGKPAGAGKPQAARQPKAAAQQNPTAASKDASQGGMNRRERRAAMRKLTESMPKDDDDSDGGGFFE